MHLSSGRARIRANFRLTPDVKAYFKKQAKKIQSINKVEFYQDEYTFAVIFKTNQNECLKKFLELIDVEQIRDLLRKSSFKS